MRIGFLFDTSTSFDNCEFVRIGGKVIEMHEGVFYRENLKITPLRIITEKMFALREKYENEHNDLMQRLG